MTFDRQNKETFSEPLQLIELQNEGNRGGEQNGQSQPYRLRIFEEMVGPLTDIEIVGSEALATVGAYTLVLPTEFAEQLRNHLGSVIAILRTDEPHRAFMLSVLSEESSGFKEAAEALC